jgi:hypothetical protein
MIAFNFCYSTIVIDEKYKNLPGITYENVEWTVTDEETGARTHMKYTFV